MRIRKQGHQPDRVRLHVIDDEIVKEHNKPFEERSNARLIAFDSLFVDELEGFEIEMPLGISPEEFKEILDVIEAETTRRKR